MPAITASSSTNNSARPRSSCGRAPRACAISARVFRQPMPSSCCRASRRWAFAWTHTDHHRANRLLPRGAGSIIIFGTKGGGAAGKNFTEGLGMTSHLANVGDAKTLVIHPASTTHQQMDAAQLKSAGIGEELVRLSVGIEAAADIIDDLGQALRASQRICAMQLSFDGFGTLIATGGR